MKHLKKAAALLLSAAVILSSAASVYAGSNTSEKEEVIYVNTDGSGSVTEINAVNIFGKGDITDYGNYSAVKMLNTDDKITLSGNKVTFTSGSDRVYYQGTLKKTEIPWNISLRYFLDGKEISAEDLAGRSGSLKICFDIEKNSRCKGDFADSYALQASFTLDTGKCENIIADKATSANAGKNRQLTYTVLPGRELNTSITAEVTDFEMPAVTINGIRMNLGIDTDDLEISDRIDEIIDAVNALDDGADELNSGLKKLYSATGSLKTGTAALDSKTGQLADGAGSLSEGLLMITSKNRELTDGAYATFSGLCTASQQILNSQLEANGVEPVTLTPENYSDVLTELLEEAGTEAVYKKAYASAYAEAEKQVNKNEAAVYSAYISSNAENIYTSYITADADALYQEAAYQALLSELQGKGMDKQAAQKYLSGDEGQLLIAGSITEMSDEQKSKIIDTAVKNLTAEQKQQILKSAESSLTAEQKAEIKDTYIRQLMTDEKITSQISEAVSKSDEFSGQIAKLKGQLDSCSTFCEGVKDYTAAVSDAAKGAASLESSLNILHTNTGRLKDAVSLLNSSTKKLFEGSAELKDGTAEFADEAAKFSDDADKEISEMLDSVNGKSSSTVSFTSDKNTNVRSLQFVIKTTAIEKAETENNTVEADSSKSLWDKFLDLFR